MIVVFALFAFQLGTASETAAPVTSRPVSTGFLFMEGEYVAPPYVFRMEAGVPMINGLALDERHLFVFTRGDPRVSGYMEERLADRPWWKIARDLRNDFVVLLFKGEPPVVCAQHRDALLQLLSREPSDAARKSELIETLQGEVAPEILARLEGFAPPAEFLARAREAITRSESIRAARDMKAAGEERLERYAYPLIVLGMVVVALSIGHLLSHRPHEAAGAEAALSSVTTRRVSLSLLFVLLMSGLDLIWTILAHDAGAMQELNPFGSKLLQNPQQLVLFKLAATMIAVGPCFWLRRIPLAQRASWWMCLLCTLLSVRWLTFNSLFLT